MVQIELRVGQHVFYFRSGPGGMVHEEAEIIKVRQKSIKVKFLGNRQWGKKKGAESNVFNTTGKIYVLNKNVELERVAFMEEIKGLREAVDILRAEVEKIYSRYDILDL
ncbi:MAG: hypothetical protein ACTSSP_01045 [Candidatus Asgardarchaeia archaeon]